MTFSEQRADLQSRIMVLEDNITATRQRLTETNEILTNIDSELESSKLLLRQARKDFALSENVDDRKVVSERQKKYRTIENRYDEHEVLAEALADSLKKLERDLEATKQELARLEVAQVAGKCVGLVDTYNKHIRAAHRAVTALMIAFSECQGRKGENHLQRVSPVSSYYVLSDLDFTAFQEGKPTTLRPDILDKNELLNELYSDDIKPDLQQA